MDERASLEQAIAALELQRPVLGDQVVDTALEPLRARLASLQQPSAEQQRKQVTVLFADVSGFTAMSESMDPEEVSEMMNALWERLDTAILDHAGTIDKHIGDAIMALFGAGAAREDDPERAIHAALDMQAALGEFVNGPGAPDLQMRIGINTGVVLLGNVGTTTEFTAMGDTVNTASRLEHAAPRGGILISRDTYRHVRGLFEVEPLEPIRVKGKAEPIPVYLVHGARPRTFRMYSRGVMGVETRMIGRQAELRRLQTITEDVVEPAPERGPARLVAVVAEAGVGKSRLLYEFENWLDVHPARIHLLKGRATEDKATIPYALIRDLFAFRFEIHDSDGDEKKRAKLRNGLIELAGREAEECLPFVGHVLGFDFADDPQLQGILNDAKQIRDRALHDFTELLERMARERAIVILLEDVHWADAGSLDLIDHILQTSPDLPLLVVATTRPLLFERRQSWAGQGLPVTRLDLHPLSAEDSHKLVDEILRRLPDIPDELRGLIIERAEGNPYYVEEVIMMLIEEGVIVTAEDGWQVHMDRLVEQVVPPTLMGVLQARLDALPPAERQTLQCASVVGRIFWDSAVDTLLTGGTSGGSRQPAGGAPYRRLHERELVFPRESPTFADTHEYIFRHALLHDVTYESVLKRLRRRYHKQVADWLSARSDWRTGEQAGRIAEHYERAEAYDEAAAWYVRAGKHAKDIFALEAAVEHYTCALDLIARSRTAGEEARRQRVDSYEGLGDVLHWLGRYTEAIEAFTEMVTEAESAGDVAAQARGWCGIANARLEQGELRALIESAERAESLATQAGGGIESIRAVRLRGAGLFRTGDIPGAESCAELAVQLGEQMQASRELASSYNLLGVVNASQGRFEEGGRYFERALALLDKLGDRAGAIPLLNNLGVLAESKGDYELALARYSEALENARKMGNRSGEMLYLSNVGAAQNMLGDYAAAEQSLREVIRMADTAGAGGLSATYANLAQACLAQGGADAALDAAQYALALADHADSREEEGFAWRILGQIAAHKGEDVMLAYGRVGKPRPHSARDCFARSADVYEELGIPGERARTLRDWAEYELHGGDPERGEALWEQAWQTFAELGAEAELERMRSIRPL